MGQVSFKNAVCEYYGVDESRYLSFVLKRCLFRRVRLVRPFVRLVFPEYLFNERRLLEKVGAATSMREIQEEVDFYQHKYVVNFVMKDALRFRLSGMRLMSMANRVLRHSRRGKDTRDHTQEPARS